MGPTERDPAHEKKTSIFSQDGKPGVAMRLGKGRRAQPIRTERVAQKEGCEDAERITSRKKIGPKGGMKGLV